MIKTKIWVIAIALLLVVSIGLSLWLWNRSPGGTVAVIYHNGELIRSIDLAALSSPVEFTIEDSLGSNTIVAEPGRICISCADCPDQVCVRSGWLSDSAAPIVCLPHRLVIRIERGDALEIDAVAS